MIISSQPEITSIAVFYAAWELKLLIPGNKNQIDVSDLPGGIHLLKAEIAGKGNIYKKVMVR